MNGSDQKTTHRLIRLVAAVLLCILVGGSGSLVTATGPGSWYESLEKPAFTPPGWVFGPAWTTLYVLMGIALYLVWQAGTEGLDVRVALGVFGLQLGLNALWSFLFFGLESPLLGLVEIIFLWLAIAATIVLFYRIRKSAAYLLLPYIAWVSFAAVLNYAVYMMNP